MEVLTQERVLWKKAILNLGEDFARRALKHDKDGTFVHENYEQLKKNKFFSAAIPSELGGGGLSHRETGEIIRLIAQFCGSTALAFSMHQHLVAALVWKYKKQGTGAEILKKIVQNQTVLVSTGARDWLSSNGILKQSEGGYLFTATKHFASQAPGGDLVVTSGTTSSGEVFHFNVPVSAAGVTVLDNWDVMGMRATGSQSIVFENVFVPEDAITLKRPAAYHDIWDVVLTVAAPLIMSAYVGLAEKALEIAIEKGKSYSRNQPHIRLLTGRMYNSLLSAQTELQAMFTIANNLDFDADIRNTVKVLSHKTNIGDESKKVVEYAMEAIGGQSFLKANTLERLFRDVQASPFHPLPKWEQYTFTGTYLLKSENEM